jgi:flagellar hook-associated protein 3 FlgL
MRITNNLLFNTTLANIEKQNARLLQTSEEASSGLRLQRPSDDPTGTRRVLTIHNNLSSLDQFKSQQTLVNSLLDGTDTALQDTETLLGTLEN